MTEPHRCTARTTSGNPCRLPPIKGGTVCRTHGGAAPQVRAKATERRVEAAARKALAQLGTDPLTIADVYRELLTTGAQAVAWRDHLAGMVDRLTEWRYTDQKGGEQLRSEIVLYERAIAATTSVLEKIARLDLDNRIASITARQRDQLTAAILAALDAGNVTVEQRTAILSRLTDDLRAISA